MAPAASTFALALRRRSTHCVWPALLAWQSGVSPSARDASTVAEACRSTCVRARGVHRRCEMSCVRVFVGMPVGRVPLCSGSLSRGIRHSRQSSRCHQGDGGSLRACRVPPRNPRAPCTRPQATRCRHHAGRRSRRPALAPASAPDPSCQTWPPSEVASHRRDSADARPRLRRSELRPPTGGPCKWPCAVRSCLGRVARVGARWEGGIRSVGGWSS